MKNKLSAIILSISILFSTAAFAKTDPGPDTGTNTSTPVDEKTEARATQLMQRLDEIKKMDMQSLSHEEKKGLRKEVKGIRKEMKDMGKGDDDFTVVATLYQEAAGVIIGKLEK